MSAPALDEPILPLFAIEIASRDNGHNMHLLITLICITSESALGIQIAEEDANKASTIVVALFGNTCVSSHSLHGIFTDLCHI
jgi:hypothetical protein